MMALIQIIKSAASNFSTVLSSLPGLKKLRGAGRMTGILGMIIQIGASAIESLLSLNPMIFIQTFGMNLVQVNQGLIADMTTLQGGVSGLTFWWHTWGIYSKLWFLLFVTGLIAKYLKEVHLGDQVPKYQLYLITFVLIITPIQMIGAVIVEVIQTGSLQRQQLWQVINFWDGLQQVFSNPSLWIEPVTNLIDVIPGIEQPDTNTTLNQTANNIQTVG